MLFKKNYLVTTFLILWLIPLSAQAQDEKVKAIFVYNFTRYIDWPEKQGDFRILVLGRSPILTELSDIATKKKVGTTSIEVKQVNSSKEINNCHIVYVASSKSDQLPSLLSVSMESNILIICENAGSCKEGAAINFINENGKLSFEISRANILKSGLQVSSSLFGLGKEIKE